MTDSLLRRQARREPVGKLDNRPPLRATTIADPIIEFWTVEHPDLGRVGRFLTPFEGAWFCHRVDHFRQAYKNDADAIMAAAGRLL